MTTSSDAVITIPTIQPPGTTTPPLYAVTPPRTPSGNADGGQAAEKPPPPSGAALPPPSAPPSSSWDCLRALQWLLCPIVAIFDFFFRDSFLPNDGFVERVRKFCVGLLALGSIAFYSCIQDVVNQPHSVANWYVLCLDGLPMIIIPWVAFIYGRITKSMPDGLYSFLGLAAVFSRIIAATSGHAYDIEPLTCGYVLVVVCAKVPLAVDVAAVAMSSIALIINNLVVPEGMGFRPYLLVPDSDPSTQVSFTLMTSYRVAFVFKIFGIIYITHQFHGLMSQAQETIAVCKQLAERLRVYDTDGARDILHGVRCGDSPSSPAADPAADTAATATSAAASPSSAPTPTPTPSSARSMDPELLKVFEDIVDNLEKYRPYLPNYVLPSESSHGHDDGDEEEEEVDEDDEESNDPKKMTIRSFQSQEGGRTNDAEAVAVVDTNAGGSGRKGYLLPGEGAASVQPSPCITPRRVHETVRATVDGEPTSNSPPAAALGFNAVAAAMKTKVSICVMSVDWLTSELDPHLCNTLMRVIHDVAQPTHASLHSFLGDRLIASWNATKRVAKTESRSCLFPLRILKAVQQSVLLRSSVALSSASCTRVAESCFAGDNKLRLFACSSPQLWTLASTALDKVQRLHIHVADQPTRFHATVDVETRGIAVLPLPPAASSSYGFAGPGRVVGGGGPSTYLAPPHPAGLRHHRHGTPSPPPPPTSRCLYQLLSEKVVDVQADQEWMYALESEAQSGDAVHRSTMTAAVETYAAGDAFRALAMIRELRQQGQGSDSPGARGNGVKDDAVAALLEELENVTLPTAAPIPSTAQI